MDPPDPQRLTERLTTSRRYVGGETHTRTRRHGYLEAHAHMQHATCCVHSCTWTSGHCACPPSLMLDRRARTRTASPPTHSLNHRKPALKLHAMRSPRSRSIDEASATVSSLTNQRACKPCPTRPSAGCRFSKGRGPRSSSGCFVHTPPCMALLEGLRMPPSRWGRWRTSH